MQHLQDIHKFTVFPNVEPFYVRLTKEISLQVYTCIIQQNVRNDWLEKK